MPVIRIIIDSFFLILFLFTLYFFRDPDRRVPKGDKFIICPADGEVCLISEIENDQYLNYRATQISIFMSPLNVHVNRIPISGKITFKKYLPGEFHVAYEDKASEKNEQTIVIIESEKYRIGLRQIAGYIARRIVNTLEIGDTVARGDRFGMIKFGSRVDIIVPFNTKIEIKKGDKVIAGETIIGYLN
jgi:phosphatidylserine decarboxylase